jgi:hypothetical protein
LAEHWASHFCDTRPNQARARYGLIGEPLAKASKPARGSHGQSRGSSRPGR